MPDERTYGLQSLRDTIHSILVSISVLVIREWVERVFSLVILGGIDPTGMGA